jgi:uncharacterized membrane protein
MLERLERFRRTLEKSPLIPYVLVLGSGGLLGLFLNEFLRSNLDFTGPLVLSPAQRLGVILAVGPIGTTLLWLCSSAAICRLTGWSFQKALALDALSYWPSLLIALFLLLSLISGQALTVHQAPVVVLASAVVILGSASKTWLVVPHVVGRWRTRLSSPWIVILAIVSFSFAVGLLALIRYRGYNIWGIDLAFWDQALWNTWQGRLLQMTQYGGLQESLLADHVALIAFPLVPLYLLWTDPRALLLLQVAALAVGAWIAYELAFHYLNHRFGALCIGLAYLCHPTVIGAGLDASGGFRPDVLALPLFLGVLLALEKRRWIAALLLAILAMACKERIATVVILLGLYIVLRYRSLRPGLAMSALGGLWLFGALGVFLPWIRGGQSSLHYEVNLGHLGGGKGLAGVLSTLIGQPGLLAQLGLSTPDLLDLFFALLSLALLPLLSPAMLAISLPIVGMFALVSTPNLFDFHLAPVFPFFFGAAILGIWGIARWAEQRLNLSKSHLVSSLSVLLLTASLSAGFFWGNGPLSWGFWAVERPYTYWRNYYTVDQHDHRADRFVGMVPPEEPILASDFLLSHLAQREWVFHAFDPPPVQSLDQVNYAIIDLFEIRVRPRETSIREIGRASQNPHTDEPIRLTGKDLYGHLLASNEFNLIEHEDGLLLFLRRSEGGQNSFHNEIRRVEQASPMVLIDYAFDDRLHLIGYDLQVAPNRLELGTRYRIVYYWRVLEGFDDPFTFQYGVNPLDDVQNLDTQFVLIDTFSASGNSDLRIIHLPTYLLLPPETWRAGDVLREEYDFVLPRDLPGGSYQWQVGMYIVPEFFPIRTESERWVPETAPFLIATVALGTKP